MVWESACVAVAVVMSRGREVGKSDSSTGKVDTVSMMLDRGRLMSNEYSKLLDMEFGLGVL